MKRCAALQDLLEQTRAETGIKKDIALSSLVDYRLLRQVQEELR